MSTAAITMPRFASSQSFLRHRTESGETFSINFLRHQSGLFRLRRVFMMGLVGYLLAHALLLVGLAGLALTYQAQSLWADATAKPQTLSGAAVSGLEHDVQGLRGGVADALATVQAIVALQRQRFPAAGKLAALTDTLPARTWLTSLSGSRDDRSLTIEAKYLIDPEAPHQLPAKEWLEALRADPRFGQNLTRLELGSSSRSRQGQAALYTFTLIAEWRALTS